MNVFVYVCVREGERRGEVWMGEVDRVGRLGGGRGGG